MFHGVNVDVVTFKGIGTTALYVRRSGKHGFSLSGRGYDSTPTVNDADTQ